MLDDEIVRVIAEYEYVPYQLLQDILRCSRTRIRDLKHIRSRLKYLTANGYIEHIKDKDAYCITGSFAKEDKHRLKALTVLSQFGNVTYHSVGTGFVDVVFMSDNELYEIVNISSSNYRVAEMSLSRNIDKRHIPKRILIAETENDADELPDSVLKELNCVALCTVDDNGSISSYDI